jgi:hypothetical protein
MKSNQHTLPLWTQFVVFHDTAEHHVHIDINGETVYNNTFSAGKKHRIKIDEFFNFKESGTKKITIKWSGDKETANKYFIFNKWAINNQHLTAFKCMYVPDENEYISGIRRNGTPEEKKKLRRQIMFGGNHFGWFGKMVYEFVLGNTLEVKKTLLKNRPEQIVCVKWNRIYIDEEEAKIFDRLPKKNKQI